MQYIVHTKADSKKNNRNKQIITGPSDRKETFNECNVMNVM